MTSTTADRSYVLPLAFATTVSMWAVAYFCRLPAVMAPSWLVAGLMLGMVALWGWITGSRAGGGWLGGVVVGAVGGDPQSADPGQPPDIGRRRFGSAVRRVVGAGIDPGDRSRLRRVCGRVGEDSLARRPPPIGRRFFQRSRSLATFLLVVAGGLVTSNEAGLAVVDWPNSFGSNMFLFPLARMTGGIYYEHAHRLFGALVGLTTIALAVRLWRYDDRAWLKRLSMVAVVLVVLQGILGGLRVTGGFTLSTSEADMAPSLTLALMHGVLGQLFLGVMVAIAVVTSRLWLTAPRARSAAVCQG